MNEFYSELRADNSKNCYEIEREGMRTLLIKGIEAGVIDFLREDISIIQVLELLNANIEDIETYLSDQLKVLRKECLEILSKKWFCQVTDVKLELTKHEFEPIDFKKFSRLKFECKNSKLSIQEMNLIIDHFSSDRSNWYIKD